jgi:LysM repeat protein
MRTTGAAVLAAFALTLTGAPAAHAATPTRRDTVTVRAGDTLWRIAARRLHNPHLWRQIMQWNHLRDPRRIQPGELLTLAPATLRRYPASGAGPIAGICDGGSNGRTVTIGLLGDSSEFRCYEVGPKQRIKFVNETGHAMWVGSAYFPKTRVAAHRSVTIKRRAGSYLAPGDHGVGASAWCCFGFDIVLPGYVAPAPSGGVG